MDRLCHHDRGGGVTDRLCARKGYQHINFFPQTKEQEQEAIAICGYCPTRATCLADAEARRETWGVHGGKNFYVGRRKAAKKKPKKNRTKPRVKKLATPPGEYGCPFCPRSFMTAHGLRTHRGVEHAGEIVPLQLTMTVAA
jgi:WhiB family redox-sensing transcriptional regulator